MATKEIYSDLPIPPGSFLEEVLDDLGMSKEELAKRMDRPASKLTAIFKGDKAITPETALQLEKVTSVPAHIWTELESEYRLTLARTHEKEELETRKSETPLITKYCYNELAKYNFVQKKTKPLEKVEELQRFFGVTSLFNLDNIKSYAPLYKQNFSKKSKVSSEALNSWLRIGEIKAKKIDAKIFSSNKLRSLIPKLRQATKHSPKVFLSYIIDDFAEAGVALVIVPHLPKTYAHGATFWISKSKAVLMTTIRGSYADIFWFSLFHEIGHLLLHKQEIYIESDSVNFVLKDIEDEANKFSGDNLIPPNKYSYFTSDNLFYKKDIIKFAAEIDIHPGIVVGRLVHDELIPPNWHQDLREKYVWDK